MLKLQTIKLCFHIVQFDDEVVLRCFIYKTLLQAGQRNGRTGYMIWNVTTVMAKYGKTRKVRASFFRPYAHFPGTRDRKKADFRAEIRTGYFPDTKRECRELHLITLAYLGRSLVRSQLVSMEFFIHIKAFRSHYGPGVDSASNRNEYQEHFLGVKVAGA